jgi:hypothetical protein
MRRIGVLMGLAARDAEALLRYDRGRRDCRLCRGGTPRRTGHSLRRGGTQKADHRHCRLLRIR